MQGVVKTRVLLFLLSLAVVPIGTYLLILFAKGYRPNLPDKKFNPTGLLVATSTPDGAQVIIDSQVTSATNTTLNLDPGTYQVEIKKDGFQPWKKSLLLKAEIVTRAQATLFPSVPSLKATTNTGASFPTLAPDGSKVAFVSGTKLFTLDLTESPLGLINREPKLIVGLENWKLKIENLTWSPDSRSVLAAASSSAILINTQNSQVSTPLPTLLSSWQTQKQLQYQNRLLDLPPQLQEILSSSATDVTWSPNEKKILYTATASATLPDNLKDPLPGSSTQPQERQLSPGRIYVYDLEEDRNFAIDDVGPTPTSKPSKLSANSYQPIANSGWAWLPDSYHLVKAKNKIITVKEYDNTNITQVYAGPMESDFLAPYPSGRQILILTNLNPSLSSSPNLYALSLR